MTGTPARGSASRRARFNPYEPGFSADPYSQYRQLRENDPAHRSFMGTWVLTRYRDIESVLRDPNFSSDPRNWKGFERRYQTRPGVSDLLARSVLNVDPPAHGPLRKCVAHAFAPADMSRLTGSIETILARHLDAIEEGGEAWDAIAQFALPVPLAVVCHLYGVPADRHEQFKRWSIAVSRLIEPLPSLQALHEATDGIGEFADWLRERLAAEEPDDSFPGCMARAVRTGRITVDHALSNLILMFPAGHETTINLIGNGLYSLLRHPDQLALLRANPDLLDDAVEEMLRYESPQQVAWRTALAPCEIGGVRIEKGEQVMALLGAANRDPEVFPDPDAFRIQRQPNPHLAFGVGAHSCLGFWFAKLQARLAFRHLLTRFPDLGLDPGRPAVWQETLSFHGLKSLPLLKTAAA